MNLILKNQILTRFLQEISPPPANPVTPDILANYTALGDALDLLEIQAPSILNVNTLDTTPGDWMRLRDVLQTATRFNPGNPPTIQNVSQAALRERIIFWQRDQRLAGLPQNDFYNRQTQTAESDELKDLIAASRSKMQPVIQGFLRSPPAFDPTNDAQIQHVIKLLDAQLKANAKGSPAYVAAENKRTIMEDLNKINKLTVVSVPQEPAGTREYCSLAESAGGVTEKVSLISMDKVRTQLTQLTTAAIGSLDEYSAARANYKLSTEAILKLPKHGDIKEVQREAMALNVSRLLGLDTTRSTMLTHNGLPALFVPFDDIKLLKEFAKGKTMKAAGFSGQTYEHYSTMNPVGSGFHSNAFVDDFGASLGLFYLCSDTDAVGAYNQNKALRNDRSLFIFDQVIMSKDKLGLDSRLSMQPIEFMMKHTRHGQGRNRTLIEDSSFDNKFASIMDLKEKQGIISQYAARVIYFHQIRIDEMEKALAGPMGAPERKQTMADLKNLLILRDDAALIKNSVEERIKKIDAVFPKHNAQISDIEVRQAMVLEKLIHNPVAFSSEGRPYRNPWTQRQDNIVKTISELNDTHLLITFDSKVNPEMVAFIKRHGGGDSLAIRSDKQLIISRTDLNRLNEAMLHPESQPAINHRTNYLDLNDLKIISKAYESGNREDIVNAIERYQSIMARDNASPEVKLKAIVQTEQAVVNYINSAKNPGFGMHVLKKFYYDVQQELQLMIPAHLKSANMDAAFAAAAKLDRSGEFNQVIKKAIQNDQLASPALAKYLSDCIALAAPVATRNNHEAIHRSSELKEAGRAAIARFVLPLVTVHSPLVIHDEHDELANVRPIEHRAREMESERGLISGHGASTSVSVSDEENNKDVNYTNNGLVSS